MCVRPKKKEKKTFDHLCVLKTPTTAFEWRRMKAGMWMGMVMCG
jgi:hypothetical protein